MIGSYPTRLFWSLSLTWLAAGCGMPGVDRNWARGEARLARMRRAAINLLDEAPASEERWLEAQSQLIRQLGSYAADEMVKRALNAESHVARYRIVRLFRFLNPIRVEYELTHALAKEMQDLPDDHAKRMAGLIFWHYPSIECLRFMVELLKDPSPRVRLTTIETLCTLNNAVTLMAAEEIAKRLYDEDRDVALWAARQMQFLVHPHVARILMEHADSVSDPEVADLARRSARAIEVKMQWRGLPERPRPPSGSSGPRACAPENRREAGD